jgi:hypothetical protein
MTDCKLKGSPRINSKKIYGVTRDDGNPENAGTQVAKTEKKCNNFVLLHNYGA